MRQQQQQSSQGNVGRWAELQGSALRRTHTAISATIINIASQPQPQQQIQQQNMSTKHTHRHRDTHTDTHRHNGTHLRQKTNVSNCVCISRPPPPPLLHSVLLQLLPPPLPRPLCSNSARICSNSNCRRWQQFATQCAIKVYAHIQRAFNRCVTTHPPCLPCPALPSYNRWAWRTKRQGLRHLVQLLLAAPVRARTVRSMKGIKN